MSHPAVENHNHRLMVTCVELHLLDHMSRMARQEVDDAPESFVHDVHATTGLTTEEFLDRLVAKLSAAFERPYPNQEVSLDDLPTVMFN